MISPGVKFRSSTQRAQRCHSPRSRRAPYTRAERSRLTFHLPSESASMLLCDRQTYRIKSFVLNNAIFRIVNNNTPGYYLMLHVHIFLADLMNNLHPEHGTEQDALAFTLESLYGFSINTQPPCRAYRSPKSKRYSGSHVKCYTIFMVYAHVTSIIRHKYRNPFAVPYYYYHHHHHLYLIQA